MLFEKFAYSMLCVSSMDASRRIRAEHSVRNRFSKRISFRIGCSSSNMILCWKDILLKNDINAFFANIRSWGTLPPSSLFVKKCTIDIVPKKYAFKLRNEKYCFCVRLYNILAADFKRLRYLRLKSINFIHKNFYIL